ncbi:hypothetical protein [Methylomonas sp. AM2-LC]|uniref:hypothetical protein n=1 Tax=Methylomonas sp. AM2-LC TaxID=3153301 RepID=UPI003265FFA9
MSQKIILLSILIIACRSVSAADTVDPVLTAPTASSEQSTLKQDQPAKDVENQSKQISTTPAKRSRVEQDNFQQSTSNAQDLFQGDHN